MPTSLREEGLAPAGAAFLRNHRGDVCIALSDPAFVQADLVIVDRQNGTVSTMMHQACWVLGRVSQPMAEAFCGCGKALLTALRPDGTVYELMVPVQTGNS